MVAATAAARAGVGGATKSNDGRATACAGRAATAGVGTTTAGGGGAVEGGAVEGDDVMTASSGVGTAADSAMSQCNSKIIILDW